MNLSDDEETRTILNKNGDVWGWIAAFVELCDLPTIFALSKTIYFTSNSDFTWKLRLYRVFPKDQIESMKNDLEQTDVSTRFGKIRSLHKTIFKILCHNILGTYFNVGEGFHGARNTGRYRYYIAIKNLSPLEVESGTKSFLKLFHEGKTCVVSPRLRIGTGCSFKKYDVDLCEFVCIRWGRMLVFWQQWDHSEGIHCTLCVSQLVLSETNDSIIYRGNFCDNVNQYGIFQMVGSSSEEEEEIKKQVNEEEIKPTKYLEDLFERFNLSKVELRKFPKNIFSSQNWGNTLKKPNVYGEDGELKSDNRVEIGIFEICFFPTTRTQTITKTIDSDEEKGEDSEFVIEIDSRRTRKAMFILERWNEDYGNGKGVGYFYSVDDDGGIRLGEKFHSLIVCMVNYYCIGFFKFDGSRLNSKHVLCSIVKTISLDELKGFSFYESNCGIKDTIVVRSFDGISVERQSSGPTGVISAEEDKKFWITVCEKIVEKVKERKKT